MEAYVNGVSTRKVDHLVIAHGVHEPALIANSSEPREDNYGSLRWQKVRERIREEEPGGWERVPPAWKHTEANPGAKKHDPENWYGSGGVLRG
jgi:hypothetical protein